MEWRPIDANCFTLRIKGSVDGKNQCVDCFNRLEAEGFQPLNTAYNGVAPFLRCCGLEWTTQ